MKIKGCLSEKNVVWKLLLWCFLMVLIMGVATVVWALSIHTNQSATQLKLFQMAQALCLFILPALIAVYLWSDQPLHWLHLDKGIGWKTALLVPAVIIVASPGINLLSHLNQQMQLPSFLAGLEQILKDMEEAAGELTELLAQADTIPVLLFNLFVMALLPAVGEELTFRGVCQGLFLHGTEGPQNGRLRTATHVAIWCTAIIFSAIHLQFYGFIPRMLLGALLGYLLCWTGSIYSSMLAHFTNNAIAVICFYMAGKGIINSDSIDNLGTGDTLWIGLLSLALTGLGLWVIYRNVVQKQSSAPLP